LTRCYKNKFGVTVHQRLMELRVRYALRLLSTTDDKVETVAYASGFRSKATFYRSLQRLHVSLPSRLRRRATAEHKRGAL
jgi:transcriptional regulator GlxA family with amidase domain